MSGNLVFLSDFYRDTMGRVRPTWRKRYGFRKGKLTYIIQKLDKFGHPVSKDPEYATTTRKALMDIFYNAHPGSPKADLQIVENWFNEQGLFFHPI